MSQSIQQLCQAIFILCILLAATFERATAQPNFGMDIKVVKQQDGAFYRLYFR